MTGIELIAEERKEQLEKHSRTITEDVLFNRNGELVEGALATIFTVYNFPPSWDKDICEKIRKKPRFQRLIIAGAFLAAELDRLLELGEMKKQDT
ncbi:MAG: hypothetical protein IPL84_04055 [Chitinophagaceae bacterium]|nr:hypothetical protein [Chitinophagaceae bacterium]